MSESAPEFKKPAPPDVYLSVERFLFREARLLNAEKQRTWLTDMVDSDVRYRVFSRELRLRRDRQESGVDRAFIYDEGFSDLDARVRQFESGMQWRVDPPERIRYFVSNIEAYLGQTENEFLVFSNSLAIRNRRVYEESHFVYGRQDVLRLDQVGSLRLLSREVDYDQRYIEGRNLLFFL